MKNILSLFILLLASLTCFAQLPADAKRDYVWVAGHPPYPPYFATHTGCGLNFGASPVSPFVFSHDVIISASNASICDTAGALLFFTNGIAVADRNGNVMPHGDSLNFNNQPDFMSQVTMGYCADFNVLTIPFPGHSSLYYIFHLRVSASYNFFDQLSYSIVSMDANNGLGDVVAKNLPLVQDTLAWGGLTAVRHINGTDWWILIPEIDNNITITPLGNIYPVSDTVGAFYRVLLDENGVHLMDKQQIGYVHREAYCNASFSPDGQHYAMGFKDLSSVIIPHHIGVFDFDRTNGLLSNFRGITYDELSTWTYGLVFSPNSRYLYCASAFHLYQWDLEAPSLQASQTSVAEWDGYCYYSVPTAFGLMQRGPDGKIYSHAGSSPFIHVIENPDVGGVGCNVIQRGLSLPYPVSDMGPNFPNFRLGGTVGIDDPASALPLSIKAYPNPSKGPVNFEVRITNNHKALRFEVVNLLGEKISGLYVAPFQTVIRYNTSPLQGGVYFALLKDGQKVIAKTTFIVED